MRAAAFHLVLAGALALALAAGLAVPRESRPALESLLPAAGARFGWTNLSCPACRLVFTALDASMQVSGPLPPLHAGHQPDTPSRRPGLACPFPTTCRGVSRAAGRLPGGSWGASPARGALQDWAGEGPGGPFRKFPRRRALSGRGGRGDWCQGSWQSRMEALGPLSPSEA